MSEYNSEELHRVLNERRAALAALQSKAKDSKSYTANTLRLGLNTYIQQANTLKDKSTGSKDYTQETLQPHVDTRGQKISDVSEAVATGRNHTDENASDNARRLMSERKQKLHELKDSSDQDVHDSNNAKKTTANYAAKVRKLAEHAEEKKDQSSLTSKVNDREKYLTEAENRINAAKQDKLKAVQREIEARKQALDDLDQSSQNARDKLIPLTQ